MVSLKKQSLTIQTKKLAANPSKDQDDEEEKLNTIIGNITEDLVPSSANFKLFQSPGLSAQARVISKNRTQGLTQEHLSSSESNSFHMSSAKKGDQNSLRFEGSLER